MKTLAEFTKTTLIGGVLIILPIYIAVLLAKTVHGLLALLAPVTAQIPAGVEFRQIAAILLLVAACFVVGLVVRTGPGLRAKNAFEQAVLEKLPGYSFLRGLTRRLTGHDEEHTLQPALVEIEDALVPALIVEELEDGSYTVLASPVGADADGRQHLHREYPVHQGDRGFLEVEYWCRRVRPRNEAARGRASGRASRPAGRVLKPAGSQSRQRSCSEPLRSWQRHEPT